MASGYFCFYTNYITAMIFLLIILLRLADLSIIPWTFCKLLTVTRTSTRLKNISLFTNNNCAFGKLRQQNDVGEDL